VRRAAELIAEASRALCRCGRVRVYVNPTLHKVQWAPCGAQAFSLDDGAARLAARAAAALERCRADRITAVREAAKQALAVLADLQVLHGAGCSHTGSEPFGTLRQGQFACSLPPASFEGRSAGSGCAEGRPERGVAGMRAARQVAAPCQCKYPHASCRYAFQDCRRL